MKIKYLVLFFLTAFIGNSNAQSLEYKAKFVNVKQLISQKKYAQAIPELNQLATISSSYSPFIAYYQALCQFNLRDLNKAEQIVESLLLSHKNWSQINEAHYLAGSISVQKKDIENGFKQFNLIDNNSFAVDISTLLNPIINKFDLVTLKKYQTKFPNIQALKNAKVNKSISEKYGLDENNTLELPLVSNKFNNNTLRIGVLLPFNLSQQNSDNLADNQYALDLYDGMLLGQKKLKESGIQTTLTSYDIANKPEKMWNLVYNESFQKENLLLGPLHIETNKIAQYYANENKIPLINPISKSIELVENKPFSYLVGGSPELISAKAASFSSNNFGGNGLVLYGSTLKDSMNALSYANAFKKISGKTVLLKKFINAESLNGLNKLDIGHCFISAIPKTSLLILSALERKVGVLPLVALRESFPVPLQLSMNFSSDLYFINPDFVNEEKESVKKFKMEYWNLRGSLASVYTLKGYDLMMYWGKLLAQHKERFEDYLILKSDTDDYLLNGFDYSVQKNENTAIIITAYKAGNEVFIK